MNGNAPKSPGDPGSASGRPAASTKGGTRGTTAKAEWAVLEVEDFHVVQAAALFAQVARRYQSRIWIARGGETADAKSPLELLALADVWEGSMIRAWAVGPDAPRALSELEHLLGRVRKGEATGALQGRISLQGGAP